MSAFVLAFDTASEQVALALGRRDGHEVEIIAHGDFEAPRQALSALLPAVERLLKSCGVRPGELDEILVGRGPGSFTGVRIGVATAKGVAHGLGAPLYGVGTLDAVAWRSRTHTGLLGVVGDAMRKEVYPALFRCDAGVVQRLTPDAVAKPVDVAAMWVELEESVLVVGNGLAKYPELFDAEDSGLSIGPQELWAPSGAGLLAAYQAALQAGTAGDGDPGLLLPVYTRLSDAEENESTRVGAVAAPLPPSGVDGPSDRSGR
ncbi:MAG: tRNA (adenosine(37)-N6)-threonylcarbamoyltransferase complex dimerization subunit type 1 TsaB [Actinomycetota bacterium]|nr:tRNA (adenosine(37)-N6)-threonylcarbamoyltransferase complex dimerization subunit type 1 TsaB [Actinomycetota bacterium]